MVWLKSIKTRTGSGVISNLVEYPIKLKAKLLVSMASYFVDQNVGQVWHVQKMSIAERKWNEEVAIR